MPRPPRVNTRPAGRAPARGAPRTVGELGEFPLIDRLGRLLGRTGPPPPAGPGDDAAVVATAPATLITTDVLVEDVHFRRRWSTPRQVGERALEINLSDVAAMGGVPLWAVVSLTLPPELEVAAADELYRGLIQSARRARVGVVGGNVARAADGRVSIGVTLLGRPGAAKPVLRSGGRPGDLLVMTGATGLADLGRMLLEESAAEDDLWRNAPGAAAHRTPPAASAVRRFLTPAARLDAGLWAARLGASAMIDVSDGLAADLHHLAEASGTGAKIRLEALPRPRGVESLCAEHGWAWPSLALSGGEDYELLFSVAPRAWARRSARARPRGTPITVIGELTPRSAGIVLVDGGTERPLAAEGWRHF